MKMSNQQQLAKLSVLPCNKTVVFYSPIEGKDVLVRTGTLPEGNSFFHALLHAHSKEYVRMNKETKLNQVEALRKSISEDLNSKKWEEASSGIAAKLPFQEVMKSIVCDFYSDVQKKSDKPNKHSKKVIKEVIKKDKDRDTFEILCELIPLEKLQKNVLTKAYDDSSEHKLSKCIEKIDRYLEKLLEENLNKLEIDSDRKSYCVKKMKLFIDEATRYSEKYAYKIYLENNKDSTVTVDAVTIKLISDKLNRDIYFLDSRTRMPYSMDTNVKRRKSIIVMWLGGNNYEVVGRLLPGNKIEREFYSDDSLINCIYVFLYKPNEIVERYPHLLSYLPEQSKKTIGARKQDLESDSSSASSSKSSSTSSSSSISDSRSSSKSKSRSKKKN